MDSLIKTDSVEFIQYLDNRLEESVVSFLNTKGGTIYYGVNSSGDILGLEEDIYEDKISIKNRLLNHILPSINGLYEIRIIDNGDIKYIVIVVAEGDKKPFYLSSKGLNTTGCYTRRDGKIQNMRQEEIDRLLNNQIYQIDLGEKPSPRQDLTFTQLELYYESLGFEIGNNFLKNLELYTSSKEFNYFAYLLSDLNTISLRFVRYDSDSQDKMVEYREFGNVSLVKATKDILERVCSLNNEFMTKPLNYSAIREIIVNAILHNDWLNDDGPQFEWFSNHFRIISSSGSFSGTTYEDFKSGHSYPKWRILNRVFMDLKLSYHLGEGMKIISNHYDLSVFTIEKRNVVVDVPFYKDKSNTDNLTKIQIDILNIIQDNPRSTREGIAIKLMTNSKKVQRNMKCLKDKGCLVREGSNKKGQWIITKSYKS